MVLGIIRFCISFIQVDIIALADLLGDIAIERRMGTRFSDFKEISNVH